MTYTTTILDDSIELILPDEFIASASTQGTAKSSNTQQDSQRLLFKHQNDPDTQISGGISRREWDDAKVEELLILYADVLSRALPLFQTAQMATREIQHGLQGIIQYSYASPQKDWIGFLTIFPAQNHVGVLIMTCDEDHSIERSQQFMDIIESISPHM